jgi:hypothetical protein
MRRFAVVLAALASALIAPAAASASTLTTAATCTSAAKATYRHTFAGAAGTVAINTVRPLCAGQAQAFSLISYTTGPASSASGQFVYDTARGTIDATHRSVSLKVTVPACYTQVDAIVGTAVRSETTSTAAPYGTATLGSPTGPGSRSSGAPTRYAGGSIACRPAPTVTFANACDGTFTATAANDNAANVAAVFLTGSRRIRLAPGHSTKLHAAKGATLTIRDSTFTTYVGTWRPPATACLASTQPPPAAARAALPTRPVAATATASPATTTAAGDTADPIEPEVPTNPPRFHSSEPAAVSPPGRGPGSILAIAAGLLMIGAGVAALTYAVRNSRSTA